MGRKRILIIFGIIAAVIVLGVLGVLGVKQFTETQKIAQQTYIYNMPVHVLSIESVYRPASESNPFKYIVRVNVEESAVAETLSGAQVQAVLPVLSAGEHSVSIPDSDIAAYIDWEAMAKMAAENKWPQYTGTDGSITYYTYSSYGTFVTSYVLKDKVPGTLITLSCYEEVGSSGSAELICSEF